MKRRTDRKVFVELTQTASHEGVSESPESRMVQLADVAAFVRRRRAMGLQNHPIAEAALQRMHTRVMAAVPDPQGQFDSIYWAQ